MKRIVFLHPHFTAPGGGGKFVLEVGRRLSERGWDVICVTILADEKIVGKNRKYMRFVETGGPISSSTLFWVGFPIWLIRVIRAVRKAAEGEEFILFPQVFPSNWWGFFYKIFFPKSKLVWMCQEPSAFIHSEAWIESIDSHYKRFLAKVLNPFFRKIDVFLARHSDFIFANSQFSKKWIRKIYGFSNDEVSVVGVGVKVNKFEAMRRRDQVLVAGGLSRFKNVDTVIDAMRIVRGSGFETELVIAGEGGDKERLIKMADFTGVKFLGRVSDRELEALYLQSKVLVLASVNEPFGIVCIEAMTYGTPVVTSDTGGPREIIKDGVVGYRVLPKDPRDLAKKIITIITNQKLFERMSEACLRKSKDYSWEKVISKMEEHFDLEGVEEREEKHFDQAARTYEQIYHYEDAFTQYKINKKVKWFREALSSRYLSILEIGCGSGEFTKKIAESLPSSKVVGFDISAGILALAKRKCKGIKNIKLFRRSAYRTGFKDNSFDVAVCFYTLHHLDFYKAGKEIRRVLKPGGLLFLSEPNILNPVVYLIKSNPYFKKRMGDSEDEWGVNPLALNKFFPGFSRLSLKTSEFVFPIGISSSYLIFLDRLTSVVSRIPLLKYFGGTVVASYRKRSHFSIL